MSPSELPRNAFTAAAFPALVVPGRGEKMRELGELGRVVLRPGAFVLISTGNRKGWHPGMGCVGSMSHCVVVT
jgi:hypothetical protein